MLGILASLLGSAASAIGTGVSAVGGAAGQAVSAVGGAVGQAGSAVGGAGQAIGNAISTGAEIAGNAIGGVVDTGAVDTPLTATAPATTATPATNTTNVATPTAETQAPEGASTSKQFFNSFLKETGFDFSNEKGEWDAESYGKLIGKLIMTPRTRGGATSSQAPALPDGGKKDDGERKNKAQFANSNNRK